MKEYYQKYIDYIKNTGGQPTIEQFDIDWEPIGPMVREDLRKAGAIRYAEEDGKVFLTAEK